MITFTWIKLHRKGLIVLAVVLAVLALGLGLGLGLTLPLKSVEMEGRVILLQGEQYQGELKFKATTRAGLIHRETARPETLKGFDPEVVGEQSVTFTYKDWGDVEATILVLAPSDVELKVREGTLPDSYLPRTAFPKRGVFDLYYEGELFRSAPITAECAPDFDTRYSQEDPYRIKLYYNEDIWTEYAYSVPIRVESVVLDDPDAFLYWVQESETEYTLMGQALATVTYIDGTKEVIGLYSKGVSREEDPISEVDEEGITHEYLIFNYEGCAFRVEIERHTREELFAVTGEIELSKKIYVAGEPFDYSTAILHLHFENFEGNANVRPTPAMSVSDLDFSEPAEIRTISFSYNGTIFSANIRVISENDAKSVTSMSTNWLGRVGGPPEKGKDLEFEGEKLFVTYGYGYRTESVDLTPEMVTGYDRTQVGKQTILISYENPYIEQTFSLEKIFRVVDAESEEATAVLRVVGWNKPTRYSDGALQIPTMEEGAWLEVEIGYGARVGEVDLTDEEVEITGFDPNEFEQQTLLIRYKELEPIEYLFQIVDDRVIEDRDPEPDYIVVTPSDIRLNADEGETLDLSQLICRIYYKYRAVEYDEMTVQDLLDDESKHTTIIGLDSLHEDIPGDYSIWVYCVLKNANEEDATFHSSSISIHVEGTVVLPFEFKEYRILGKDTYVQGEALDISALKLYRVFSNGSEERLEAMPEDRLNATMFEGFETDTPGENKSIVVYVDDSHVVTYRYTVVGYSAEA